MFTTENKIALAETDILECGDWVEWTKEGFTTIVKDSVFVGITVSKFKEVVNSCQFGNNARCYRNKEN